MVAASKQGAGRWCSGKVSHPEVSKDQPAVCTGLGGEELACQAGQNEAKALLQRCLFRPPGEEKCLNKSPVMGIFSSSQFLTFKICRSDSLYSAGQACRKALGLLSRYRTKE